MTKEHCSSSLTQVVHGRPSSASLPLHLTCRGVQHQQAKPKPLVLTRGEGIAWFSTGVGSWAGGEGRERRPADARPLAPRPLPLGPRRSLDGVISRQVGGSKTQMAGEIHPSRRAWRACLPCAPCRLRSHRQMPRCDDAWRSRGPKWWMETMRQTTRHGRRKRPVVVVVGTARRAGLVPSVGMGTVTVMVVVTGRVRGRGRGTEDRGERGRRGRCCGRYGCCGCCR